jgi:RNA polymerase sigma factor (sigma-70 family)
MPARCEKSPSRHGVVPISLSRVPATRCDALIEGNLRLVPPIALRIHEKLPPSFDVDDLISEGYLGLVNAAHRYRPREHGNTPFAVYARRVIGFTILGSIRRRHYTDATHQPLEDAPQPAEAPPEMHLVIDRHDKLELIRKLRDLLTAEQLAVLDVYYSAAMPNLGQAAKKLKIPKWKATLAHASALEILRGELAA